MALKPSEVVAPNLFFWRIFGCWPSRDGSLIYKILYNTYGLILIATLYVYYTVTLMLSMAYATSLEEINGSLFISLTFLAMTPKFWNVLTKRKIIWNLLDKVDSIEMATEDDEIVADIVRKSMKNGRYAHLFLFHLANVALVWFYVAPLADISARKLPFLAWYGIDHTITPWYELLYTYQCIGVTVNCLINCTADTFPSAMMSLIVGQLQVLAYKIQKIGNEVRRNQEGQSIDNEIIARSVEHHNFIAQLVLDIENIFGISMLFQFILSGVIICNTGFLLSLLSPLKDTLQFTMLIVYFATTCLQIFLPCYFGNQIMLKSGSLMEAAFFSSWYETQIEVQKNMILFVERAKRPLKIYAGKMLELNLQTFSRIIHSSYSYYVVLQHMQNKAQIS